MSKSTLSKASFICALAWAMPLASATAQSLEVATQSVGAEGIAAMFFAPPRVENRTGERTGDCEQVIATLHQLDSDLGWHSEHEMVAPFVDLTSNSFCWYERMYMVGPELAREWSGISCRRCVRVP